MTTEQTPALMATQLPNDVVRLVVAAREAWETMEAHGLGPEVSTSLDNALEAFASRVCYDDDGGSIDEAHADPCTCAGLAPTCANPAPVAGRNGLLEAVNRLAARLGGRFVFYLESDFQAMQPAAQPDPMEGGR